jgi:hypothetical protein
MYKPILNKGIAIATGLAAVVALGFYVAQWSAESFTLVPDAEAATQAKGAGGRSNPSTGARAGAGQGGAYGGGQAFEDRILRGGSRRVIIILEDDDSDRPDWAQGNRDLNPHAQGGGQPPGAGVKKGDLYGDLYVILRDANGEPVLDTNGHVQLILSDGSVIQLTEDGEIPPEYVDMVVEVEFSRLSVVRSPDKVAEQALAEALSKLDSASNVTLDAAGRLVVDGVTIDSPLENLAIYVYVMTTDEAITWAPTGFDPSSLLGAASDKTTNVSLDQLIYLNTISGINYVDVVSGELQYYDYSTYDYSREVAFADAIVTYLKDVNGDGNYVLVTEPVMEAVFQNTTWTDPTADGGADDFAQAADDTRAVIEFIHSVPVPAT